MISNSIAKLELAERMLTEAQGLHDIAQIRDIAVAARAYAKAAMLGIEATNKAALVKIKAERKAGEYLKQLDRGQGERTDLLRSTLERSSNYTQTLEEAQISKTTAHRWQKMADVPEPVFNKHVNGVIEQKDELTSAGVLRLSRPHVANNSGNNEWYTPPEFIEAARRVMGHIDFDPASSPEANTVVKADFICTAETNGLEADWWGNVWLNPPYAGDLIGKFCEKLVDEWLRGEIEQVVILVNNATETAWFQMLVEFASCICFPKARVKFWKPSGETGAPLQGQAILYIGNNGRLFAQEFSHFGFVAEVNHGV